MAVKLYYDKTGYGLQTEAPDEQTFRQEFVAALAVLVEAQTHQGTWQLALHRWLGQLVDICHSYQGHRPEMVETRILYSAGAMPGARSDDPGEQLPIVSILDEMVGREAPRP